MKETTPERRKRLLAFLCRICPFCILARRFPDSAYARSLREAEEACPACRAYRDLHADSLD
jgi:rubrerythrin